MMHRELPFADVSNRFLNTVSSVKDFFLEPRYSIGPEA